MSVPDSSQCRELPHIVSLNKLAPLTITTSSKIPSTQNFGNGKY